VGLSVAAKSWGDMGGEGAGTTFGRFLWRLLTLLLLLLPLGVMTSGRGKVGCSSTRAPAAEERLEQALVVRGGIPAVSQVPCAFFSLTACGEGTDTLALAGGSGERWRPE